MSYSSQPIHPLTVQSDRRPSLELSRFSTTFQQWELGSDGGSSGPSRRGSQQHDPDYPSSPHTPLANINFDNSLGAPPARQRTTQACDKCRDRKTKCSGDHPVCKRCTTRGLICHYSGRERVRGPAKARLRNAMSSSSLDLRFAADGQAPGPGIKQEELDPSLNYSLEYPPPHQPQYQHLAVPPHVGFPYFEPSVHADPHAMGALSLSRISLPQVAHPESFHPYVPPHLQRQYVRRVQSYSALGASDVYRSPHGIPPFASRPTSSPAAQGPSRLRLGPSSVVEYDMRMPNGGIHDYHDDGASSGSEPPSATDSVFSIENISRSSQSSESALPEPLSRSASELDLRMLNQVSQYRHQRLPVLDINGREGKAGYHSGAAPRFGFHSPAASINSLNDMASPGPRHADIFVPQVNGEFGNPWAEEQCVTVREVELMYPSPVTPISLGSDAFDPMLARGGFYGYMGDQEAPPEAIPPAVKEEKDELRNPFEVLNSPLTTGTAS
ncbi:hypothetical protein FB451DRAFT_1404800 [Mycena latifolia]|nr:hypothetical protein FB451DRAFT_1404800 [Mycena latifolia]